jgi:hypothetical protein
VRREITVISDDLTGEEGAETILFAIDGRAYQIDLGPENAEEMRTTFAKYTVAGRMVGRGTGTPLHTIAATRVGKAGRNDPAFVARVKAWAKDNGQHVPSRGRIPGSVVAAYKAQGGR